METTDNQEAKQNRRTVKSSTTLSRKYTKRPKMSAEMQAPVRQSPEISRFGQTMQSNTVDDEMCSLIDSADEPIEGLAIEQKVEVKVRTPEKRAAMPKKQPLTIPVQTHPIQIAVKDKMDERSRMTRPVEPPKVSAKELKEQAIRKALASANSMDQKEAPKTQAQMAKKSRKAKTKTTTTMHFGFGRVMLALGCATAAVMAIVYFVNLNMPDISLRVAAMQTGMDPTYPTYIPRNYSVSGITSQEGRIVIEFVNSVDNKSFSLTEEKSSWDTNTLLNNFVKPEYGDDHTVVREQGLTIYISGSNATWVNGGIVYKITAISGTLTNKQIRSIAVSL